MLELLLSLAIMAMLSLSGYLILDGVLRSQTQQSQHLDNLRQLQRAIMVIDKDFQQIVPRLTRDGVSFSPIFSLAPSNIASDSGLVRFVRAGWHNPQGQFNRSEVERVAYVLQSGTLKRLSWKYLDSERQNIPDKSLLLLNDLKTFTVEAFARGRWQSTWQSANELPRAVRLTLAFTNGKQLQRIYRLHAGPIP